MGGRARGVCLKRRKRAGELGDGEGAIVRTYDGVRKGTALSADADGVGSIFDVGPGENCRWEGNGGVGGGGVRKQDGAADVERGVWACFR